MSTTLDLGVYLDSLTEEELLARIRWFRSLDHASISDADLVTAFYKVVFMTAHLANAWHEIAKNVGMNLTKLD